MVIDIVYLEETLDLCEVALSKDAQYIPLVWVIKQLKFIESMVVQDNVDFVELEKIKLAHIATKEMDGYHDKSLIHRLCVISNQVQNLCTKRRLRANTKQHKYQNEIRSLCKDIR